MYNILTLCFVALINELCGIDSSRIELTGLGLLDSTFESDFESVFDFNFESYSEPAFAPNFGLVGHCGFLCSGFRVSVGTYFRPFSSL